MNTGLPRLGSNQLEHSILKAIDFLARSQLPHGEFRTYASPDRDMAERCEFDSSPFVTSIVLYSIGFADGPKVQEMTEKALGFLLAEMEGPGLWRYWSSRNQRHKLLPPDLDDTCCVSFILKQNYRPLPCNRETILANRNGKGVFYTWLVPRSSSPSGLADEHGLGVNQEAIRFIRLSGAINDIDCVANANALLYLGDCEATRPVIDYLVAIVRGQEENYCSAFYPDRLSFYYALSRAYRSGVVSLGEMAIPVTGRVIRTQDSDGSFGNELLTALAVCTILNFNRPSPAIQKAVACLLNAQKEDGAWPRLPMFLGPAPYYGSEELTTALCVEALSKFRTL